MTTTIDTDNIVELHRHVPDVESIVSRLNWHKDKIKNIITIVEWDSGEVTHGHNAMACQSLLWFATSFYENAKEIALYGNGGEFFDSFPYDDDNGDDNGIDS